MEGDDNIENTLTVQWYQSNDKMKKWLHEDESDAPCIPGSFCLPVPCLMMGEPVQLSELASEVGIL